MQIYVMIGPGKTINVEELESDCIVEKLKERIQEFVQCPPYKQRLVFDGTILHDGRTLAHYNVMNKSTLYLVSVEGLNTLIYVKTSMWKIITVEMRHTDTIYEIKSKVEGEEHIPRHKQVLLFDGKELEDDRTLAHYRIDSGSTLHLDENSGEEIGDTQRTKRARVASADCQAMSDQAKATTWPSPVSTVLEALNRELGAAQCKKKEADSTISKLTHENKVTAARCASYERQIAALEAENEKMKELLMAAGSAQGQALLKKFREDEKAKWLKSYDFLDRLTQGAVQYFDHGFDSCQKQAENQGFVGRLDKDAALQEAPELEDVVLASK